MALDRARRVGAFTTHTEFSLGTPTPTLPRKRRAIAYGIFNESSLRTQGPIRRGLSFSARCETPSLTINARGDDGVDGPLRHRDVPE